MAYKTYKKYPINFSKDIIDIVNILSIKSGKNAQLYGSSRFKIDFPGDYDFYQEIELKDDTFKKVLTEFQEVIKKILNKKSIFLGDIKSGMIEKLKVIDDDINETNYNSKITKMKKKLKQLYKEKRITKEELDDSIKLLKPDLKNFDLSILKHEIRFEVIRWKPEDILKGFTIYRGYKINFYDYLLTDSATKIDVMAWVNGIRYAEITMVYFFSQNGKMINRGFQNLQEVLKDTIPTLLYNGKYMKICKRMNAIELTRDKPNQLLLKRFYRLYNSNLGRLSQIISDLTILQYLIENIEILPENKFKYEIDMMKYRLGNMTNEKYLKQQEEILKFIDDIEKDVINIQAIDNLKQTLNEILQSETLKVMKIWKIYPVSKEYLP
jgi:hypothetical protein